jgi:hypothetical protein
VRNGLEAVGKAVGLNFAGSGVMKGKRSVARPRRVKYRVVASTRGGDQEAIAQHLER